MEAGRQADLEQSDYSQADAPAADALAALRTASLPDEFWMYSYKVLPCPHGYRHSWTHCPFSHAGETARRRCPRAHRYLPDPCPNARAKRPCPNGDACPYAHNTFEQWLHPVRYRTRLCYLGANCRRPTCFFAHSVEELRSVEEAECSAAGAATGVAPPPLPPLPCPPPLPAAGSHGPASTCEYMSMGIPMGVGAPPHVMTMGHGTGPYPAGPHPQVPASVNELPTTTQAVAYPHAQHMPMPVAVPIAVSLRPAPQHPQQHPQHPHPHAEGVSVAAMRPVTGPAVQVATAPAGVYIQGGMGPAMPGVQGLSCPLPSVVYVSPFGAPPAGYTSSSYASGYYVSGSQAGDGRTRSWSTPGEGFIRGSGASAGEQVKADGAGARMNGIPSGAAAAPASMSAASAPLPPAVAASPRSFPHGNSGGVSGSGNNHGGGTPRHMPTPSNRATATARRVSTPATSPAAEVAATAATAAAAVAAMRYPAAAAATAAAAARAAANGAGGSPLIIVEPVSPGPETMMAQGGQRTSEAGPEEAFRQLSLSTTNSKAMLPPATTMLTSGDSIAGSPPGSASAPLSAAASLTGGSPFVGDPDASAALGLLRAASGPNGGPASFQSAPATAPAAAHGAGAAAAPYQALLQQVLRSASAPAAEQPPATAAAALLPMLLHGISADAASISGGDTAGSDAPGDRFSDPGQSSLHAAIRRISSEMGHVAAASRNSDPAQGAGGAAAASVYQLLLPLLQMALTEGLASGHLELVHGQLQVRGAAGAASSSGGGGSGRRSPSVGGCTSPSMSVSSYGTE